MVRALLMPPVAAGIALPSEGKIGALQAPDVSVAVELSLAVKFAGMAKFAKLAKFSGPNSIGALLAADAGAQVLIKAAARIADVKVPRRNAMLSGLACFV
jgi:hypothetical protein